MWLHETNKWLRGQSLKILSVWVLFWKYYFTLWWHAPCLATRSRARISVPWHGGHLQPADAPHVAHGLKSIIIWFWSFVFILIQFWIALFFLNDLVGHWMRENISLFECSIKLPLKYVFLYWASNSDVVD